MRTLLVLTLYPILALIIHFAREHKQLEVDIRNWCRFKGLKPGIVSTARLFAGDKAFRTQLYYRAGATRFLIAPLFPGYDHLQINTKPGRIGPGLIFQHGFATIVAASSIGSNCKIYQQVTIGFNHRLEAPAIGDNVEICCGAKLIGGIKVGNNVLIGANAVVTKDIPDNSIVAGIPAKVIGELANGDIFNRVKTN